MRLVLFCRFEVAVKRATDPNAKEEMLHEAKTMARLTKNRNIVNLQGICIHQNQTYLILEYCALGSVESYLRKHAGRYMDCIKNQDYEFLFQCCIQVIEGMLFLIDREIIHGDLAARNVLITSNKTIKVADFGLSHRLYLQQDFCKSPKTKDVPFLYSAIEVVSGEMTILECSDIWSFAVYMWEVFGLCRAIPYSSRING